MSAFANESTSEPRAALVSQPAIALGFRRPAGRAVALVVMVASLFWLTWGATWQKPRVDPWARLTFWQWWVTAGQRVFVGGHP